MTDEKLNELIEKLNNSAAPRTKFQIRHYRAAVALYESKLRAKYGRSDYWRVMLRTEADILGSLRKALLIKQRFVMEFYRLAQKVDQGQERIFADALSELGFAL